jgi:Ca2+/Na+ antiporter
LLPYLALVIVGARLLERLGDGPRSPAARLAAALHEQPAPERPPETFSDPTHHLVGLIVIDVVVIIAGSAGMVQTALRLASVWHIRVSVLGVLILGPLTSLPNALTAVRLGTAGRGAALVGETFNSNSINLCVGVILPALFIMLGTVGRLGELQLAWLLGTTIIVLILLARPRGMGRGGAALLIALYVAFVTGTLVGS